MPRVTRSVGLDRSVGSVGLVTGRGKDDVVVLKYVGPWNSDPSSGPLLPFFPDTSIDGLVTELSSEPDP